MVRNGFLLRFFSSWTHDQWPQRCSPALGIKPMLSAQDANIPRYVFFISRSCAQPTQQWLLCDTRGPISCQASSVKAHHGMLHESIYT